MTLISPSLLALGRSANDAPPRHLGTRYNTQGLFLLEPGNTVVSHVAAGSPSEAAVLAVRDRLMAMPEARQFAFTQPSSLHMTIFQGIIEHRRKLPYWPAGMPLDTPIEVMTAYYRERLAHFAPLEQFRARVTGITPTGLALEGDGAADRACLKAWRDAFAEAFGYRHPDHDDYQFHITYAYPVDWLDDAALPRWQAMLDEQLAFLREQAPVIALDPPAFCSFEDMNHFEELIVFSERPAIKEQK